VEELIKQEELKVEEKFVQTTTWVRKECTSLKEAVEQELKKRSRRENDFIVERTKMQASIVTF
jgi:hypothetical protein